MSRIFKDLSPKNPFTFVYGKREEYAMSNPASKADGDNAVTRDEDVEAIDPTAPERETWSNSLEFLMSCISMSIGLGNIWRFPYTVYKNGGGAFLIPYIVVLLLVGKPLYYMEMILGQFSSKGFVKFYDFSPAMRGTGIGITLSVLSVMTFYGSVMALVFYYLFSSFSPILPWTVCEPSWGEKCYPSSELNYKNASNSSSVLFFKHTVLREFDNIEEGIGLPEWKLSLCLLFAWTMVFFILVKGVKSSGKVAYVLAIFPYVIMISLLAKALTLPGSLEGIWFFLKPDWSVLLKAGVWYDAVIQCFFSLNVCFGNVIMYASYNKFRHNIYRDTLIVTTLDTFTSLLAGATIFGILGNLADETGNNITEVVTPGPGIAFMSYPEAISKFKTVPQVFSVLFFLMLAVLGIGSNVAIASSIITVIRDQYQRIAHWKVVMAVSLLGFVFGLAYITPGGQFALNLVEYHGASYVIFFLGIAQILAVTWIYGMRKFCDDIEFMLDRKVGIYWRLCWPIITPLILLVILCYNLYPNPFKSTKYNDIEYPTGALAFGWTLSAIALLQLPIYMCYTFYKKRNLKFVEMIKESFRPNDSWGPTNPKIKRDWIAYKEKRKMEREQQDTKSRFRLIYEYILGY